MSAVVERLLGMRDHEIHCRGHLWAHIMLGAFRMEVAPVRHKWETSTSRMTKAGPLCSKAGPLKYYNKKISYPRPFFISMISFPDFLQTCGSLTSFDICVASHGQNT